MNIRFVVLTRSNFVVGLPKERIRSLAIVVRMNAELNWFSRRTIKESSPFWILLEFSEI
jgi:hypothetical protein